MSPTHFQASHEQCQPMRQALDRVGDKWSVLVVGMLGGGPKRFSELRRMIDGVSQRMLTLTLRGLERDVLVTRTVYPTVPPRVDYALTPAGRTLLEPVRALAAWTFEHWPAMQTAQKRFDAKTKVAAKRAAART